MECGKKRGGRRKSGLLRNGGNFIIRVEQEPPGDIHTGIEQKFFTSSGSPLMMVIILPEFWLRTKESD